MKANLLNLGGHGLGDCLLSLQISSLLKDKGVPHINCLSTRKEVFEPINHIFGKKFDLIRIDEKYSNNNRIIDSPDDQEELKNKFNCSELTFNVPDLLFRNPLAFKYSNYGLHPSVIKKHRTLTSESSPKENLIYCGLATSTSGYLYSNIQPLLRSLAEKLPDYTIYFPNIKRWDKETNMGDFNVHFPANVFIHNDPRFEDSLDYLLKSKYGIFTCNGPSHVAYQLGTPRLVLDPQFNKIPWISRWKEDYEECIPMNTEYSDIVDLVVENVKYPETTLIDRKKVLELTKNGYNNWKDIFYFKY